MLLTEKRTERIDLGDGDWAEVRVSLSTKEALLVQELQGKSLTEGTFGVLELLLVSWSDDAPLTRENIEELKPGKTEEILARLKDVIISPDPKVSSSPLTSISRRGGTAVRGNLKRTLCRVRVFTERDRTRGLGHRECDYALSGIPAGGRCL